MHLVERTDAQFHHQVCSVRALGSVADRLRALAVPVCTLAKGEGHDWTLVLRIARLCRTLRPHIVHTRNWGSIDGIVGARLARVPVVIHSEHGRELWAVNGEHLRRRLVRRALAPFVDRFVVVSEDLRQHLLDEAGISPRKLVVIRNGVDPTIFAPAADRERLRLEHGYHPSEIVVGAVGRLDPVKGHADLMEAFRTVAAAHRAARLIIVGDGTDRRKLERQAENAGVGGLVRFVGHCNNVAGWLGGLDIFVQPSIMEGLSNALLEAMAVGLPVVATRTGGNSEIVRDGVTGRLVPVGNRAALAGAITSYCDDAQLRARHGAAGRQRIEREYSIISTVAQYAALYHDTLARRGVCA